ncbi:MULTISPECIES: sensor domain-containing diguanylate cyclase [Aeromonas]|uniref:GGDEF domain-containing protein n=1 Tax=Aeromonas TaxID=642 RepID=UPI00051C7991|nr:MULTISPECIES: GGDEF domain-containing protein [Aeromonas]MCH7371082.1 GGDEF domain-containing protein [Aeromonas sp. MR16]
MDASILLKLDVFTLMLMALGGYALGFITLSIIWLTHREIPGLGLWWWSSLCALAAQSLFFLQAFMPNMTGIWLANLLITLCIALMPLALQRFFDKAPSWRAFAAFMVVYVLLLSWSVLFNDEMAPRVLLACLSYMVLGAVIVLLIWRHGYPAYLPAVLVFTVVNILLYGFNLVRMGALLSGEVRVLMDQHAVNVLPFLSMLMGNYLSTFGVLLLCTQYRALALRQQASQDPLTGLLNRRGFMARCAKASRRGALVVLDLDDFKQINDRHGHEAGDRVLAAVGTYLAGQRDLVASRFGGEEFVLLLPQVEATAQQARCEQIRQGVATLALDGIGVTASLGLAPCTQGWHFDTLFSQADRALYQAKRSGKNRVCQNA